MTAKKQLTILLLIALAPILLSYSLVYFLQQNKEIKFDTNNYGLLYRPSFKINFFKNDIYSNQKSNFSKWMLAYFVRDEKCNELCKIRIAQIAKSRILLNDKKFRVEVLLISNNKFNDILMNAFNKNKLIVLHVSNSWLQKIEKKAKVSKGVDLNNTAIFIDPLANAVLQFNAHEFDIEKIVKDMKRLLTFSRLG